MGNVNNNNATVPTLSRGGAVDETAPHLGKKRKDPKRPLDWVAYYVSFRENIIAEGNIEVFRAIFMLGMLCATNPFKYPGRIEDAKSLFSNDAWLLSAGISQNCAKCIMTDSPYWHYEESTLVIDCYAANEVHSAVMKRCNQPKKNDCAKEEVAAETFNPYQL